MSKFINVNRIEFIVTWQCNSFCKHCSVRHKRESEPAGINAELSTKIIREVSKNYAPSSIMTFGGEPLLFPEIVYAIHNTAKNCGISKRQIITNAGYPRSEREFQAVALKLAESGVTNITVSVDGFHQEHIPIRLVEQNVRALIEIGIPVSWNPCWVISKEQKNQWNEQTRAILSKLAHLHVRETDGNIFQPNGNALKWLNDFVSEKTISPDGDCGDIPYTGTLDKVTCISVEPNGDISVCKDFPIGNAKEQNIFDILQSYNPYNVPEMEAILSGGVSKLEKFASNRGIVPDVQGYFSICDKCVGLRHRLKLAGSIN